LSRWRVHGRGLRGKSVLDGCLWATTIATDSARASGPEERLHFEENIKPLFRERERDSMCFAFDLWSLDDVSAHADAIL
jgi:hypothetical protein